MILEELNLCRPIGQMDSKGDRFFAAKLHWVGIQLQLASFKFKKKRNTSFATGLLRIRTKALLGSAIFQAKEKIVIVSLSVAKGPSTLESVEIQ